MTSFTISKESLDECDLCDFMISCATRLWRNKLDVSEISDFEMNIRHTNMGAGCTFRVSFGGYCLFAYFTLREAQDSQRRLQPRVDWQWLRSRFDYTKTRDSVGESRDRPFLRHTLQNVLVVDVKHSCIVPLPRGSPFVALSYVWGAGRLDDLKLTSDNIDSLMSPGALDNTDLPATIRDAIEVCNCLNERFLWVDRLCIIQDTLDAESLQLKQMASLYSQAVFTIAAASGDSAAHGLAGVSLAREEVKEVKLPHELSLVENLPDLDWLLFHSKWWQRGWTYQEHVASSTLLFFTEYELFLYHKSTDGLYRESVVEVQFSPFFDDEGILYNIEEYSQRTLSFQTDKLRAFAGILQATCGNRTSFGLPWDHFDEAILWDSKGCDRGLQPEADMEIFPTWSWASAKGPVYFADASSFLYGLAYWGRFDSGPMSNSKQAIGPPKTRQDPDGTLQTSLFSAMIAWAMGCARPMAPEFLKANCSKLEYLQRLRESRITIDPSTYWSYIFHDYNEEIFKDIPDDLSHMSGRILVHTQKASFTLDQKDLNIDGPYGRHQMVLARYKGKIVGRMELNVAAEQLFQSWSRINVDFISVAISTDTQCPRNIFVFRENFREHISASEFYGCPCSVQGESLINPQDHFKECPHHPETDSAWHEREVEFSQMFEGDKREHRRSNFEHISDLAITDPDGNVFDDIGHVPSVCVLLIAPSPVQKESITMYQRIGIGQVYLKRWVEAAPKFESIVLE